MAVTDVATEEVSQANLVAASRIVVAGTAFAEKDDLSIAQELADVVNYALLLADRMDLDLPTEIRKKIRVNARKYPVRKSKGLAKKYTEL